MENRGYKYDAFISYRHLSKDEKVARTLQKKLEQYTPPAQAAAEKKKLSVFLDDSELSAGGDLWERIHAKLAESKYLILVCSRETKESIYCMDEIRTFKELHGGRLDHILILLLEGTSADAFPEELTFETREVRRPDGGTVQERCSFKPLYCDLRGDTEEKTLRLLDDAFLRLAAPLFGCEYDDLFQRHMRRRAKRKAIFASACGVCMLLAALLFYGSYCSRRARALTYENMAEACVQNEEWAEALMYYGEALSLDAARKPSQTGALLLLQQQIWPCLVREEEDINIWGDTLCPRYYPGEKLGKSPHLCVSADAAGGCLLWQNKDAKEIYDVTDLQANPLYTLEDKGTVLLAGPSPCWIFYRADEQTFTFYWPEDQTERRFTWRAKNDGSQKYPAVCPLDRERTVVNDNHMLYVYGLEQSGRELMRLSLDELFKDRPCDDEAWAQAVKDGMGISLDGSLLAVNASASWEENGDVRAWNATALFDTKSMELLSVIEAEDFILSNIVFSADGEQLLLLYDNSGGFAQDSSFASVYSRDGELLLSTEAEPSFSPKNAAFCGDMLLIWNYDTIRFWEVSSMRECAVPLKTPGYATGAAMTEGGLLAVQWAFDVHYYQFIRFEGRPPSDTLSYSFDTPADTPLGQKVAIVNGLYACKKDEKTLILTDDSGAVYDSISLDAYANLNLTSSRMFYSSLVECLFLVNDINTLYCFPLRVPQKQFREIDDAQIDVFAGCVCPANDGIFYWNYALNEIRHLTTDIFDPTPQYLDWSVMPENTGLLLNISSDAQNYLIFILWDSSKENVIVELRDIRDGTYIQQLVLDKNTSILGLYMPGLLVCEIDGDTVLIQLGAPQPPNPEKIRQLLRLSGRALDEDQNVIARTEPVRLEYFDNWLEHLVWRPGQ